MVRMDKVLGRTDDMLIIRGVNVFPSQVEHVLLQDPDVEPQYMIFADRQRDRLDTLEVWVEASNELYVRGEDAIEAVEKRVRKAMQETLYVSAAVRVVGPGSIERSLGKARRVVDRRELG